jgi:predicted Holliday junction resolvase-like endonuclease
MDPLMLLWVLLIGMIIGIIIALILLYRVAVAPLRKKIKELVTEKQSQSTIYGLISEQFAPFMKYYPYNPGNFRFIGTPVDGIQFEKDKIIFVEIKTHKSKLTSIQNHIKKLVKDKKVDWFEFKINK